MLGDKRSYQRIRTGQFLGDFEEVNRRRTFGGIGERDRIGIVNVEGAGQDTTTHVLKD